MPWDKNETEVLTFTSATNPASSVATTTAIIDAFSGTLITNSGTAGAQTLANPTGLIVGKTFTILNNDTSTTDVSVIANSVTFTVTPGEAQTFIFDGSAWGPIDIGITTLPVPVNQGGTGLATITDHAVMVGSGTGAVTPITVGTNGQVLVGSTGADPVFATITDGEGIDTTLGAGTLVIACEDASTSNKGVSELATNTEALTGESTSLVITPANMRYVLDRYQPRENLIGIAGQMGFGVGICPVDDLPTNMTPMTGHDVLGNDNYGNYQFSDGSVMVWVPKFYYKITTLAIDIKGVDTYATTALANAAGYALHRAFMDGGAEKSGVFVDKYMVSKVANGTGYTAASIKNGLPLSSAAAHNPFSGLTGGADYYYSAIDLAHRRDGVDGAVNASSIFFCCSRFIYGALAMLSMAHGQAATSTTNCAWYHATYNYPKGCNNNALKDCDDTTVIWESDGYSNCGKTGSAGYGGGAGNVFAKSTHNGQNCGVADLNGLMYEIAIGVTCDGTDFYVAKQATAMKTFTNGDDAANTDHWGREAAGGMYDTFTVPFSGTGWQYFGSGANQVLSEVTSGNGWLLTGLGLPKDANGMDGTGTNLFGKDGFYRYTIDKLCLVACAYWDYTSSAGVWCVGWDAIRASSRNGVGFRAAAYPA